MSYHSSSLKEFVYPIPICQPEADLSNILPIFQHLNCKMVAVPLAKKWEIITAENLLSLIVKNCWEDETTPVSEEKNFGKRQKTIEANAIALEALIEPAMLEQDETKLAEFLSSFEGNFWLREKRVCLIINAEGELLGRLDRSKIIQYLSQTNSVLDQVTPAPTVINSLEEIALPVKIETANRRVICANQRWRELSGEKLESQRASAPKANLNKMTQWLIEQQDNTNQKNIQVNSNDLSSFGIEVTQRGDWNYLKIPLKKPETKSTKDLQYLVLATAISVTEESQIEQIAIASDLSSDRILATACHELKSPLTGILGLSSLLQEQTIGSLNQRQIRYVKLICCSSRKMMRIVDNLLQLNALTGDLLQSTELINLELLCRRLYQEILTKLRLTEEDCDLALKLDRSQLLIELGSNVIIANKPLLCAILSHLLSEAIESGGFKPPKIAIKNRGGLTAIEITNQKTMPKVNLGFNWIIAEHLSDQLRGRVTYDGDLNSSKFTLLLPKNKTKLQPALPKIEPTPQLSASNVSLTILCLYPELGIIDLQKEPRYNPNFDLKTWSDDYGRQTNYQHRIIEADSLEQAHNLARIWQLDAIVLDGYQIALPELYLRSLQEYEHLANLPLITLDVKTTEAANLIEGLNVYPCLLPTQQCNIDDLLQVIRIALESKQ